MLFVGDLLRHRQRRGFHPTGRATPIARALQIIVIFGCTVLVVNLPWVSTVAGVITFLIGLIGRWVVLKRRDRASAR